MAIFVNYFFDKRLKYVRHDFSRSTFKGHRPTGMSHRTDSVWTNEDERRPSRKLTQFKRENHVIRAVTMQAYLRASS